MRGWDFFKAMAMPGKRPDAFAVIGAFTGFLGDVIAFFVDVVNPYLLAAASTLLAVACGTYCLREVGLTRPRWIGTVR